MANKASGPNIIGIGVFSSTAKSLTPDELISEFKSKLETELKTAGNKNVGGNKE